MPKIYTVAELLEDLKVCQPDEQVVVVIDDGAEDLDELEEGSVLAITEAGGFQKGMRIIRVRPL